MTQQPVETERDSLSDPTQRSENKSILWVSLIVLFIIAGTAFWWVPFIWPQVSGQKALEERLTSLEGHLKVHPPLSPDDLKSAISGLEAQVITLRSQITQSEQRLDSRISHEEHLPLLLAFLNLKIKVRLGEPYVKELSQFKKLTKADVSSLEAYANIGVPSLRFLLDEFSKASQDLSALIADQHAQTFWEKLIAKVRSLVKIEKVTPSGEHGPSIAILQNLVPLIKKGEFLVVFQYLDQQKFPEIQSLKTWRLHADAYRTAEHTLDQLEQNLFSTDPK